MVVSDVELVARVRLGDVEAFGKLVQRYERTVLAVAISKLRDFHTAEDVTQSTFLLAFKRLGTLRDDAKFGAWLIQIAHAQVMEAIRSRRIPAAISLAAEHAIGEDAKLDALNDHEQILTLVAQLPDHERVLIGLRYFDGHTMAQAAVITGRPIGTVTKQLSRAIERLRNRWQKENST